MLSVALMPVCPILQEIPIFIRAAVAVQSSLIAKVRQLHFEPNKSTSVRISR